MKSIKSFLLLRLLPALRQTKNYARIVGVILFLIGLLGFAFRSDNSLPDLYLGGALLLGFWGIISGLWDSGDSNKPVRRPTKLPDNTAQNNIIQS